jgi:large subunit ribosomal protein L13
MKKKNTFYPTPDDISESWVVIDAKDKILGRLASKVANIIRGKESAHYTPSVDPKSFVIVLNSDQIKISGNKAKDKFYYRHSGYPGGLKSISFEDQMTKDSTQIIFNAVKGMLPSTKLGSQLQKKLKVYTGEAHPHDAQSPAVVEIE